MLKKAWHPPQIKTISLLRTEMVQPGCTWNPTNGLICS